MATKSIYAIYFVYCKYCQETTKSMNVKSRYTIVENSMHAIDLIYCNLQILSRKTEAMYVKSRHTIAVKLVHAMHFIYCKYSQETTKAVYFKSGYTVITRSMLNNVC